MIFPPEIIEDTTEALFVRRSVHSKAIYWVVVTAVAATVAVMPFIYVQISVQARGIIRTPFENNQIQSSVYGEITHIRMAENMLVNKGDTLLALNTGSIEEQIRRNEDKIREYQLFIADLSALLEGKKRFSSPKYSAEWQYCNAAIGEQQIKIDYLAVEYRSSETLYRENFISRIDYLQRKNAYEAAVGLLDNLREQFRNRWEAERAGYEFDVREWKSTIRQLEEEKAKYVLRSPESGSIIRFSGVRAGNFIAPGQTIGYIASDSNLLVECHLSPADVGYIMENQSVNFQLDAFNHYWWGLAHGKVKEISKDMVMLNDRAVFLTRCSLDTPVLTLKNGYHGRLQKGMTLTGRFYLTDRSLWQLLFDKIDNWINPKAIAD